LARLDCGSLALAVDEDNLHLLASKPMRLEKGPQIALTVLAPIMHHDLGRLNLDQVKLAAAGHEPDDSLRVGSVERHEPLSGPLQDRLVGVVQRPSHRIINTPAIAGGGVEKPKCTGLSASGSPASR